MTDSEMVATLRMLRNEAPQSDVQCVISTILGAINLGDTESLAVLCADYARERRKQILARMVLDSDKPEA